MERRVSMALLRPKRFRNERTCLLMPRKTPSQGASAPNRLQELAQREHTLSPRQIPARCTRSDDQGIPTPCSNETNPRQPILAHVLAQGSPQERSIDEEVERDFRVCTRQYVNRSTKRTILLA